jgi:protein involved in polysaccharide export with SLBB domain
VKPLIAFVALFGFGLAMDRSAVAAPEPEARVIVVGDRARGTREVPYSDGLTASKAIIAAGGYGDLARTPIYLIRCGNVSKLDVRAFLERGEHDKDVPLKPWDIIAIGTSLRRPQ